MKPVKAIDLVFKAQPKIAALRRIVTANCDESKTRAVIADIDDWLRAAQVLMTKKGGGK